MNRRHLNIPIEIVRTVVAISETGSLTKAAEQLGLSQPAVSAQIKRLEHLVGGSLFVKTPNGSCCTELGKLVLAQARKIIEANDQVLALGGADSSNTGRLRLGLSSILARKFMTTHSLTNLGDLQIHAATSSEITNSLVEGHTDIACFFLRGEIDSELAPLIVDEAEDRLVWVCPIGLPSAVRITIPRRARSKRASAWPPSRAGRFRQVWCGPRSITCRTSTPSRHCSASALA
jgi:DNA-binding transcriptional LysR family regulator